MIKFKVVDKDEKVLGWREKQYQAEALYREKYKAGNPDGIRIVAVEKDGADKTFDSL